MQLLGSKRLKDGRTVLPAGQYTKPTENQAIMNMETGEIIAPSLKDQRIAKMIEDNKKRKKEAEKPALSPSEQRKLWVQSLPNSTKELKKFLGSDFTVKSEKTIGGIEIQVRPSKSAVEKAKGTGRDPYWDLGRTGNAYSYQAAAAKIIESLYPHLKGEWIAENLK
jgi:hypothetical protein